MPDQVRPIPDEFGSIVVQLTVPDVAEAVAFYRKAFGADELYRSQWPGDRRVFHCEVLIGSGRIMLHDEFNERGLPSPKTLGGTATTIHLYVADAATTFDAAIAAGGRAISAVTKHFWGVVSGTLEDPYGHRWIVATRVEDLGPEEILVRSSNVSQNERLPVGKAGIKP